MKTVKKEFSIKNGYVPVKIYNGLDAIHGFKLERDVYTRLQGEKHFPKIISIDEQNCVLEIENTGNSLDKLQSIDVADIDKQIDEICESLKRCGVTHLDIHPDGKNITVKGGVLYLVDFDMAVIDEKPVSNKLECVYKSRDDHHRVRLHDALQRFRKDSMK